jgi:hypothetical protein
MKYGIIFCGNLSDDKKISTLQKRTLKTMVGAKPQKFLHRLM